MSELVRNIQAKIHKLSTFITNPLFPIYQEKITPEITCIKTGLSFVYRIFSFLGQQIIRSGICA